MQVKGVSGTISFDGALITISRTGFLARATVGKGEKRIPLSAVTAVQFKPAGALVSGFIQFTLAGGNEQRSQFGKQTYNATGDENSVVFTRQQQPEFEALRTAVEFALAAPALGATAVPDLVDQLKRLTELRDSGAVNAQEYADFKARLLSG
ncbi:MAG: DUF4429 domain-containing protein [Pseudonocardiaceae bacterium]